jgi:tight adherence protein B
LLVFAALFAVMLAAFLLAYDRLSRRNRRLRERMRDVMEGGVEDDAPNYLLLRDTSYSHIPFLDRILSRFQGARRLQNYISEAGLPVRAGALILTALTLAGFAGLLAATLLDSRLLGVVVAIPVAFLPFAWVSMKRRRRIDRFEELLPEAIDLIVNALKSGFSLESSLSLVAQELPDPVGTEFAITFEEQNLGVDFIQALDNMTQRMPSDDLKILATAISIQRRTGGNLAEILGKISNMIRERFTVRREIRILTAQGRLSGGILVILPLVMAMIIHTLNRDYLPILIKDPAGPYVLAVAVVLQLVGIFTIRRIVSIRV